ncbi:hypothetical protein [Streptomyces mirabilis]|uniref:hypothetical protein n=1 Tax=Streptomyces mirabilis TaxID=68239 RepID=UPI0033B7D80E
MMWQSSPLELLNEDPYDRGWLVDVEVDPFTVALELSVLHTAESHALLLAS